MPTVSVIMPTYNSARYMTASIDSVLGQTFKDLELLLIDDGSSDNSLEIARQIAERDERVKVVPLSENHGGPGFARNKGIRMANGRYVAFLDSDDLWKPNKLHRQLDFMRDRGVAFSYHHYRRMDENGKTWGAVLKAPKSIAYVDLLGANPIGCLTAMVDIEKTGKVQSILDWPEDFSLWLNILKMGYTGHCLPEDLASYRIVPGSFSRNKFRTAVKTLAFFWSVERISLRQMPWVYASYLSRGLKKNLPVFLHSASVSFMGR